MIEDANSSVNTVPHCLQSEVAATKTYPESKLNLDCSTENSANLLDGDKCEEVCETHSDSTLLDTMSTSDVRLPPGRTLGIDDSKTDSEPVVSVKDSEPIVSFKDDLVETVATPAKLTQADPPSAVETKLIHNAELFVDSAPPNGIPHEMKSIDKEELILDNAVAMKNPVEEKLMDSAELIVDNAIPKEIPDEVDLALNDVPMKMPDEEKLIDKAELIVESVVPVKITDEAELVSNESPDEAKLLIGNELILDNDLPADIHKHDSKPCEITAAVDHPEHPPPVCQVPEETKDIKIGTLIALLAPEGEDWQSVTIPASEGAPTPEAEAASPTAPQVSQVAAAHGGHIQGNFGPSVRLLLEQYGLTPDQVPHGGPHGILVKGDVLKTIKERNLQPIPLPPVPPPEAPKPAAVAAPTLAPAVITPAGPPPKPIPGVSEDGFEDIEITNIRRVIAKRLTQSKSGIAHSYGTLECRTDELIALRKQYKQEGINVSINDIIIKAVAVALTLCPEMNCVWQGEQLLMSNEADISVAVATPSGLITPIVFGANNIGIEDIASRVRDLAGRARENKLKPEEFQGGTFTISNLGMFGISEFSAIINPPQCGILAVGGSRLLCDESGNPVTYMSATLSYDRAGVDDETAANFLNTLKSLLENPSTMLLGSHSSIDHPMAALL
ncbi:pyruvate dehydrogenase protein X component-like isoform X2 [Macrobrachium rosenbergii]